MEEDSDPGEHSARPNSRFPIVGIGCSPAGMGDLQELLQHVDADSRVAFVVIQNGGADPSGQTDTLSPNSLLPVVTIQDGLPAEPSHVFVAPYGNALSIQNGIFQSTPTSQDRSSIIDEFFFSLSQDQPDLSACVILSGTGTDGMKGLRAVKENGGFVIAQREAEFDGMMHSAVETGLVDFVLPVSEMPAALDRYFGHLIRTQSEREQLDGEGETADYLHQITDILRAQTGNDFAGYKDRTIIRRVQRRMNVLQIDNLPGFLDRLRSDSKEVTLLFRDLLIGVTSFFRDQSAFAALESEVIPQLFRNRGVDDTIRIWVPGCSSGEEAYSIAMLLREGSPKSQRGPKLQLFASDIDDHALAVARAGRYPASIAQDVTESRLERFFVQEDGTYRVTNELREICLFSSHNILHDAPFSKLDLISCRNLLIYLGSDLQDRIIPLFHYALNEDGFLLLGTSENVTRHARLFSVIDRTNRLFQRRTVLDRWVPHFPFTTPEPSRRTTQRIPQRGGIVEPNLKAAADRQLLDHFAPTYVIVNAEGDLIQASGRTGKYFELQAGVPDTNILNMARTGLRLELRAALHRALGGKPVVQRKVVVGVNGGRQEIDLHIQQMQFNGSSDRLYMVVFQDLGAIEPSFEAEHMADDEDVAGANVRQLENELRYTRERLQTATEELESSNEELKSSNEELQSINEELQSTNEELETSKEELQSINEELQTVNNELSSRVDELSRANNDMRNLLESTQIATIFLDRDLLVKSFTPAAKDVFRLIESDTGRPIMHVRPRVDIENLQEDAERVLRTLGSIEKPVDSNDTGTRYMMRLLPYRTAENVINGVVMTFTDITRMTAAEARIDQLARDLRTRADDLEALLDLVPVGMMIAETPDRPVLINSHGARLLGQQDVRNSLVPMTSSFRLLEEGRPLAPSEQPLQRAARSGIAVPNWSGQLETAGGTLNVMISARPLFNEGNEVRGAIAAIVELTASGESH
jgi:two-component system, chemotaxis family, CheB/CheR fusion protein